MVTLVPLVVGLFAGKSIFKFRPGILLGVCAGARSTTAARLAHSRKPPTARYLQLDTIPYAVSRIVMAMDGVLTRQIGEHWPTFQDRPDLR